MIGFKKGVGWGTSKNSVIKLFNTFFNNHFFYKENIENK